MENTNFYLYNYLPKELLSKEGKKSTEKLKEISLIGLYFGALSCPPCNYFKFLAFSSQIFKPSSFCFSMIFLP